MGIQINGNTNNINAGIGSLSIEDLKELDIVGVATAANFKTGSSNLHTTGLTVGNNFFHSTGINVGTGATIHVPSSNVLTLGTNSNERLRIESGGDLRLNNADSIIHTSADTSRLRIFGGSTNSTSNGAALALHGVNHSAGNYAVLAAGNGGFIKLSTGTTEVVRIQSTGVVNIGDTTATSQNDRLLQIGKTDRGATYLELRTSTSGVGGIVLSDGTGSGNEGYRGTLEYNHSSDYMLFKTAATERVRIDSNGKVAMNYDAGLANAQYGNLEILKDGASNVDPNWSYLSFHRTGQIAWQQGINANNFVIASSGGAARDTLQNEKLRIATDGSSYFGPQIITEDNLRWGHDANQRPYVFSGATGSNPADATIIAANPNTDPSGTRLGGFGFGCVTSSASGVANSGLKAVIEGLTNNNVSDAWKTGARIRFLVRPDNGNLGEVFSCNSDGTIDQIANLTSNISLLRLKNARTRASGNKYGIEFRDNINEANANIVIQQNSSGNNAAHMSFYTSGGTGGNGLENGNHTLRLKQAGDVEIPTGNLEFRTLSSSPAQAAPASINLGGTHSNAAGNGTNLNAKLKVWSDGTDMMGFSVSSNQLDYILTSEAYDHVWYAGNSGTTEMMRLEGDGNLTLTNGNKLNINKSYAAGQGGALLNIGWDQGTNIATKAIDIGGGWSAGENKRITFSHSTGSNNLVGEINSIHYGGTPSRTSPHSGLRFGKLYHNNDSTTFTMSLDSTSTTTADLNLKGAYRSPNHPAFCVSGSSMSNFSSLAKMQYTTHGTHGVNQDGFDNSNDRFVAPVDGVYHFYVRHWYQSGTANSTVWLYFYRNGSQIKEVRKSYGSSAPGEYVTVQLSTTVFLSATNYIEVYGASTNNALHPSSGSFHTEFSGFMVC